MTEIRKTEISQNTSAVNFRAGLRRIRFELLGSIELVGARSSDYVERAMIQGEMLRMQSEGSEVHSRSGEQKKKRMKENAEGDGHDNRRSRPNSALGNIAYTVNRLGCIRAGLPNLIKDDVDKIVQAVKKRLNGRDEEPQEITDDKSKTEDDAEIRTDKHKSGLFIRQMKVALAIKNVLVSTVDEFSKEAELKGRELDHVMRKSVKEQISGLQNAAGGFYNVLGLASNVDVMIMKRELFRLSEAMRKEGEKDGETIGLNRRESPRRTDTVSVGYDRRLMERRCVSV